MKMFLLFNLRKLIYVTLYQVENMVKSKSTLTVLCYHGINRDNWRFSIDPEIFKAQINYLLENNYHFISPLEFATYFTNRYQLKKKSILLSFDDGYENVLSIVDFIHEKNIKPIMFLLADTLHVDRHELASNDSFLKHNDIKKLLENGWSIGSHTLTHPDLTNCTQQMLFDEIIESKKQLEKTFSCNVEYFSYPKGRYNFKVQEVVKKAGYEFAFTMDDGFISRKTNKFSIPRVGIDRSHTSSEFRATISWPVILFRKAVKNLFLKYISYV